MYEITKLEYGKNHDGDIVSICLAVRITKDNEQHTQEYALTPDEIQAVLKDSKALTGIIETTIANGLIVLENIIATKPQPTVYATGAETVAHIGKVKEAKIVSKMAELKAVDSMPKDVKIVEEPKLKEEGEGK